MAKQKSDSLPSKFVPKFWDGVDGRLTIYKDIQIRYQQLVEDTNANSAQKLLLCQRAVFLAIKLETMEVEASTTGEFEFGVYCQAVNALVGILNKLGFEKAVKDIQNIESYISRGAKS